MNRHPDFDQSQFNTNHPLYNDLAPADSYQDGVYWVSESPGLEQECHGADTFSFLSAIL